MDIVKNGDAEFVLDSRTPLMKTVLEFKKGNHVVAFFFGEMNKSAQQTLSFSSLKKAYSSQQNSDRIQTHTSHCEGDVAI